MAKEGKRISPVGAGILQAFSLLSYIGLVAVIFWRGSQWFGQVNNYLGPLMVLTLLVLSVLICGFIVFGYAIKLFFIKDRKKEAIKVVAFTGIFTFCLFLIILLAVILM